MILADRDLASIQNARALVAAARKAADAFLGASQEQTDAVVEAMAQAALRHSKELASLAVEETGMGRVDSKILKNNFVSQQLHEAYRPLRTCGVRRVDRSNAVIEIAVPVGVVAGIIPSTNPTSTAIFKILIAVKGRNSIILSPHPAAERCIRRTVEILVDAARAQGAPDDLISCMRTPTLDGTHALMKHPETSVIVATGGPGVVDAAYSSGKPAFGVGPGNTPVYVHTSACPDHTARCLVASQTFDNGTICSSEQALVVESGIASALREALVRQGAYFLDEQETSQLEDLIQTSSGTLNTRIVGRPATVIAEQAGITVPDSTTLLIGEAQGVGPEHPLSRETLCPVLAWYTVTDWQQACERSIELIRYGGSGHTMGIHSRNNDVVIAFGLEKPISRLVVNGPTSQGAVGYATGLAPSMTLGCGSMGGNITSDNIGPEHLIDIRRVAYPRQGFFMECEPFASLETAIDQQDLDPARLTPSETAAQHSDSLTNPSLPATSLTEGHRYREDEVSRLTEELAIRAMIGGRVPPPREYYLKK